MLHIPNKRPYLPEDTLSIWGGEVFNFSWKDPKPYTLRCSIFHGRISSGCRYFLGSWGPFKFHVVFILTIRLLGAGAPRTWDPKLWVALIWSNKGPQFREHFCIMKPNPFKGLNIRIPIIIHIKGRGLVFSKP